MLRQTIGMDIMPSGLTEGGLRLPDINLLNMEDILHVRPQAGSRHARSVNNGTERQSEYAKQYGWHNTVF